MSAPAATFQLPMEFGYVGKYLVNVAILFVESGLFDLHLCEIER